MSLDRLRRNFHTGDIPLPSAQCLDPEVIAALAEGGGSLAAEARARALQHVASCPSCRRAVASVVEALVAGPITHEIEVVEGRPARSRRWVPLTVPLAAAAVVLVLLWSPANDRSAQHRGGGGGQGSAPAPLGPIGTVAAARHFDWSRVAGSDLYRITLFNAGGTVVYEAQLADTTVVLPDSVRLDVSQPYLWKVQSRMGWDRWTASALVEFTIARAPPK